MNPIVLSADAFNAIFYPLPNELDLEADLSFGERYGTLFRSHSDELNYVRTFDESFVWTLTEDATGQIIRSGLHENDANGYLVTLTRRQFTTDILVRLDSSQRDITAEQLKAMLHVVDYLGIDEERHYLECNEGDRTTHIWNHRETLRRMLEGIPCRRNIRPADCMTADEHQALVRAVNYLSDEQPDNAYDFQLEVDDVVATLRRLIDLGP